MNAIKHDTVTFVRQLTARGVMPSKHLEDVRDELRVMRDAEDPHDEVRPLNQCHLEWHGGQPYLRLLNPGGRATNEVPVTRHALGQLAQYVLPTYGANFLRELAALGADGDKAATIAGHLFLRNADDKPRMLRTIHPSEGAGPLVRAVVSDKYAPYDDLELVEDMLNLGMFTDGWRVAGFERDDRMMRVRMIDTSRAVNLRADLPAASANVMLAKQDRPSFPMVDVWNGEAGSRSWGVQGGMFILLCTNGAMSIEKQASITGSHIGDVARVAAKVRGALNGVFVATDGTLDQYNRGMSVVINDMDAMMQALINGDLTEAQQARVVNALDDDTTARGPGGQRLLASYVDAVSLAAQAEDDMGRREGMEILAGRVLRKGLDAAEGGAGFARAL